MNLEAVNRQLVNGISMDHPFAGSKRTFDLRISEDGAELCTSEYEPPRNGNLEWSDYTLTATIKRDVIRTALDSLFKTGESVVYESVIWTAHSEGRDEHGKYNEDFTHPRRQMEIRLRKDGDRIVWQATFGNALFDEVYRDPSDAPSSQISSIVTLSETELRKFLSKHPEALYQLTPRKFEFLIADILRDAGFDAEVTRTTRDGGYDIFALHKHPLYTSLLIVECKRYTPPDKVGIDRVQRLFGVQQGIGANSSMIVTTSFFSRDAERQAGKYGEYGTLMTLADFSDLKRWLAKYNV